MCHQRAARRVGLRSRKIPHSSLRKKLKKGRSKSKMSGRARRRKEAATSRAAKSDTKKLINHTLVT